MAKKIVIIGGVAAGMSFAARYRRLNEEDELIVLERGGYISFANCGLPYHLSNIVAKREELLLQSAKSVKEKSNINVFVKHEAVKINKEAKTIDVLDIEQNNTYSISYDILVLAMGSKPFVPNIDGLSSVKNFLTLRNVEDMDLIKSTMANVVEKEALVLGGGFIGLEVTDNLVEAGFKVTVVEITDQVMPNLDKDMSLYALEELEKHGVAVKLSCKVERFEGNIAYLSDGTTVNAPIIIAGMGVRPDSYLAVEAGLNIDTNGGIIVSDIFEAAPSIYAIGDVTTQVSFISGARGYWPLANPANRQGRLLADILNGSLTRYKGIIGVSIAKIFGKAVGGVGLNERALKKEGFEYLVVSGHLNNHASYYPNASKISYKLLFGHDGKILGFQAAGADGVDKRLDIVSTAIKGRLSVWDMIELETAYAPPFGSSKDLVIMACYAATNILEQNVRQPQHS